MTTVSAGGHNFIFFFPCWYRLPSSLPDDFPERFIKLGTLTKRAARSTIIKVPNIKRCRQQEVAFHEGTVWILRSE